jgi:hypothetical protein
MESRTSTLFSILLFLLGASIAVLIAENRRPAHGESFQRLVGGLGFGPALELSDDAFAFDPRLDGVCEQDYVPLAGGSCFCPRHTLSLFFYPPLPSEDKSDALYP